MIISKTISEGVAYFNLHAEEIITSNFIEDDRSGVFTERLQVATILRVIDSIVSSEIVHKIVFDFKNILACQKNLNTYITKLKRDKYKILLLNLDETLCSSLLFDSIENSKNVKIGTVYDKFFLFEDSQDPFTDIELNPRTTFEDIFKNTIKEYTFPHDKPHTSSYVYLTAYVDVKSFISKEKPLLLYSLYLLALKVRQRWSEDLKSNPILICQSLNSAYLVSILSTLLQLDILIFDQIGPINQLYNRIDSGDFENKKYIVVSDLVCLGTEVKIVKNIIQFMGGKCLGNISLIKTETLKKSDIKKRDATLAIFSIKKENSQELKFNIRTNLEH